MNRFLSNATNRIDAKGRVSVPAHFRSVIASMGGKDLYAQCALGLPALNVSDETQLERWEARLAQIDPLDPFAGDLETQVYANGTLLKMDSDGRIMVTDFIRKYTGITEEVTFSGQGTYFRIWEPQAFEAYRDEALKRLLERRQAMADLTPRTPEA